MIKNLHLGVSAFIIIAAGLTYGVLPNKFLPILFDFYVDGTDLKNVFRAVMGLYLAMSAYWIMGILKPNHWRAATISCVVFMGGLAFGRIIGLLVDGIPSSPFVIGLVLELLLMIWGIVNLRKEKS